MWRYQFPGSSGLGATIEFSNRFLHSPSFCKMFLKHEEVLIYYCSLSAGGEGEALASLCVALVAKTCSRNQRAVEKCVKWAASIISGRHHGFQSAASSPLRIFGRYSVIKSRVG